MPDIKYTVNSVWGRKKIISSAGKNKWSQPVYMWQCIICEKIYGPRTGTEISRNPYSRCCPRRFDEKTNYKGYKLITGSKMTQYKDGALRRGLSFSITAEYLWSLWEKQNGLCAYTGQQIQLNKDASLDRIDSNKGYVEGNLHWVSWKINRMKLNIPHEEFIELCSLVASRNGD